MHGYAGSLYFAGLLQSPIPLPSTSGVNSSLPPLFPVSEDPPTSSSSLTLEFLRIRAIFIYGETGEPTTRCDFYRGSLLWEPRASHWEEGERGRMVLIFREESEARRGWFLGIALLSFAIVFFFL